MNWNLTFLCRRNNVEGVEGEKEQSCWELITQKPELDRSAKFSSNSGILIAYMNCVVFLKLCALLSLAHEDDYTGDAAEYSVARAFVCLPC